MGVRITRVGGATTGEPARVAQPIPFQQGGATLSSVMGKSAGQLIALFGQPNAEVREGTGQKLQFAGPICVLDAYLYPRGSGQPLVSYVDARQTDGRPIDRGSCVSALQKRGK